MLSIKRPDINLRYTAPGQHDRSPGGGEGSPEEGRRKEGIGKEWKTKRVQKWRKKEGKGRKDEMRKTKKVTTSETEEGRKEARVTRQYKERGGVKRQSVECNFSGTGKRRERRGAREQVQSSGWWPKNFTTSSSAPFLSSSCPLFLTYFYSGCYFSPSHSSKSTMLSASKEMTAIHLVEIQ